MSDDVDLSDVETDLANRIRSIDRDLDELEQRTRESVIRGLHSSRIAILTNLQQTSADEHRTALLAERDDLVARLKQSVAGSEDGAGLGQ